MEEEMWSAGARGRGSGVGMGVCFCKQRAWRGKRASLGLSMIKRGSGSMTSIGLGGLGMLGFGLPCPSPHAIEGQDVLHMRGAGQGRPGATRNV